MRPRVPWMSDVDRVILEIADKRRRGTSASDVFVNWPENKEHRARADYINRRMRILYEHDLLEKQGEKRGYYQLSELGARYLHDPDAEVEDFVEEDDEDEDDEE